VIPRWLSPLPLGEPGAAGADSVRGAVPIPMAAPANRRGKRRRGATGRDNPRPVSACRVVALV